MSDPFSITSGVVELVTFAETSSIHLLTTICGIQSRNKHALALKRELEDLIAALKALQESATNDPDANFDGLQPVLYRCGNACKEYGALISRSTGHTSDSLSGNRDWKSLRYLQGDITDFKDMLAGYKAVINIALANANIRIATISPKVLQSYETMMADARCNLNEHLQNIDSKLQRLSVSSESGSGHNNIEWQAIMQEKRSTQQGLEICAQLSSQIDLVESLPREHSQFIHQPSAHEYVKDGLGLTRSTIQTLPSQLRDHEGILDKRMESMQSAAPMSDKTTMELAQRREKNIGGRNWKEQYIPVVKYLVPYRSNPDFVGRSEILKRLKAELDPTRPTNGAAPARVSLHGLGGVGKTQIALEYVRWLQENHPTTSILWVHASNTDSFRQAYTRIAEEFQIPGHDDAKVDIIPLVKDWFERKHRGRWLMVIDNADDSQLVMGKPAGNATHSAEAKVKEYLENYLPNCTYGDILITTRNKLVAGMFTDGQQPIEVVSMSAHESEHLLRTRLAGTNATSDDLVALSSRLEHLPLALVQTAAFIRQNSITVGEYLQLWGRSDENVVDLLSSQFESVGKDPTAPRTMAQTWDILFQQLETKNVLASGLLSFMSFLDPDNIPAELLSRYSHQELAGAHRPGKMELTNALNTLKALSFVAEEASGSFTMHRQVQSMAHKWLTNKGTIGRFRREALMAVSHLFPYGTFETRATCAALLSHANAVLRIEGSSSRDEAKTRALLLYCMAGYFDFEGKWSQAERLSLEASRIQKELWGLDHPSTLMSMATLASTYRNQGRWDEAEKLGAQVVEIRKKLLGADDLATLTSIASLASTYRDQGRWDEAETLEVQVMETCKVKLGLDHPDTLTSMGNLAATYRNQGRWEAAEKLEVEVLESRKLKLGHDHPSTLTSMTNLASTYRDQGRWEAAEKLEVEVLETHKAKLGDDHPSMLTSMANLVSIYWNQGRLEAAEELGVEVMEKSKAKFGADHPSTLTSMANLVSIYWNQGRLEAAEELGVEVMEKSKAKFGADHPSTLTSMANLASTYRDQGRLEAAEELGVEVMEKSKAKFGADHPSTLTSMANLASTYRDQGRWEAAEKLGVEVLESRKMVLGPDHPDMLITTAFLVSLYESQARQDEAEPLKVKIRNITQRITGAEHLPGASDSQPMNPDQDSAYASASRIETISVPLEPPFEAIAKPPTVQDQQDADRLIEEVHSIASDDDDIGSQASNETTIEGMTGKALVRVFLAEESQFRALCQKALVRICRRRFVNNMRKLLRLFYKDLVAEAQNEAEKAVASLLRSRRGRLRISNQLADFINEEEEDWESSRANREVDMEDKHRIETWLSRVGKEQELDERDDNELSTSSSDDDFQSNSFPFTSELENFLQESKSLRRLKENFMLAFLPSDVRHVLLSIPRQLIWVSHEHVLSFSDRLKAWVEDSTQTRWNWWPLKPRKRMLHAGEARVFWQCTCGSEQWEEVSVEQAEFVDKIIAHSDERPRSGHGCIMKGADVLSIAWLRGMLRQIRPSQGQSTSLTARNFTPTRNAAPGLSSYQLSSPGSVASAGTFMPSQPSQYRSSATSQQIQRETPNTASQIEGWILFGVQGASRTITPAQIPVNSEATDYSIFQELRKWYRLRRGRMRLWFSIWRLEYCDIVKFHRLALDRMVHDYRELPIRQDYQYEPRPPAADAQNPPIRAHCFQTFFYTCPSPCSWYIPHDCNPPQAGRTLLERIPKRRQSFERDLASPIWGLETVFEPSLAYVFAYHVAILVGPFVLWGWWLKSHPGDLQNASVPITIVITGLSLFWSGAGILTRKRPEA